MVNFIRRYPHWIAIAICVVLVSVVVNMIAGLAAGVIPIGVYFASSRRAQSAIEAERRVMHALAHTDDWTYRHQLVLSTDLRHSQVRLALYRLVDRGQVEVDCREGESLRMYRLSESC